MFTSGLGPVDIAVLILYIAAIISIGFIVSRRVKTVKDFTSAGQSLSPLVMIASCLATFFGAFAGSGAMEMIGQFGLTTLTILLGANVGWFVMALMAGKMRKSGALTYPAYIRRLFGAKAQAASSMISVVYLMGQIAGQFVACGTMAHLLGLCSFQTGIVAGGIIMILLSVSGGLSSVTITDSIQQIFITIMCVIVVPILAFSNAGGLKAVAAATDPVKMSLFQGAPSGYVIGTFLSLVLAYSCEPSFAQRIFAAKDEKSVVKETMFACLLGFLFTVPMWGAALTMPILFPGESSLVFLPLVMKAFLPPVLRGLGIAAFISLLLTTGNALLVSETSVISNDILPRIWPDADERQGLLISRGVVVALGGLAVILGLYFQSVCAVMLLFVGMYGASIFPPVLLSVVFPKRELRSETVALCMGITAVLTLTLDLIPAFSAEGIFIGVPVHLILLLGLSKAESWRIEPAGEEVQV